MLDPSRRHALVVLRRICGMQSGLVRPANPLVRDSGQTHLYGTDFTVSRKSPLVLFNVDNDDSTYMPVSSAALRFSCQSASVYGYVLPSCERDLWSIQDHEGRR